MKYELLEKYRDCLETFLSVETARVYKNRLDYLLTDGSNINPIKDFDINKVLLNLSKMKYKNYFSQAKNALLYFCHWQKILLSKEVYETIKDLESKTIKKNRKMPVMEMKKIENTINHLKNQKLKLSFQTMLKTGLRVSELANITPNNCTIEKTAINIYFICKGSKFENITIKKEDDTVFFERLLKLISDTKKGKRIFYSANYLQQKAKDYNFQCHDLRRAFAKIEYKKTKSKKAVAEKLKHQSITTTDIYLNSNVKIEGD